MPYAEIDRIRQDTAITTNARVPMDLHPDMIDAHAEVLVDPDGGPALSAYSAARKGMQALYSGLGEIDAAHEGLLERTLVPTLKGDGSPGKPLVTMAIPDNRKAELASAMGSRAERLAFHYQRCIDDVDKSIADLDARVAASIKNPRADTASAAQEASEIRKYLKTNFQHSGERIEFIRQAAKRGELNVVAAVCNASPWISGLNPEEAARARSFAVDSFAPRESKQATALRAVKQTLLGAVEIFKLEYAKRKPNVAESKSAQALAKLKGAA
jgi:hypothetical protein